MAEARESRQIAKNAKGEAEYWYKAYKRLERKIERLESDLKAARDEIKKIRGCL